MRDHMPRHCAHRAAICSQIAARLGGRLALIIRAKRFIFLNTARAQRGLFRRCSQQGAQNGPPPPRYAYCRSSVPALPQPKLQANACGSMQCTPSVSVDYDSHATKTPSPKKPFKKESTTTSTLGYLVLCAATRLPQRSPINT